LNATLTAELAANKTRDELAAVAAVAAKLKADLAAEQAAKTAADSQAALLQSELQEEQDKGLEPWAVALIAVFAVLAVSVSAADPDPCLAEDYAEANYGTCCAQGGYKLEGHGEICKSVGPKVKSKKEL